MSSNEASSSSTITWVDSNGDDVRTTFEVKSLSRKKSTSDIYGGRHTVTGDLVAINSLLTKPAIEELQFTTSEIEALLKINHPHIIRLIEIFDNPEETCLVMELAEGGELSDRMTKIGKFTEKDASGIVYQVLDAVAYLHDAEIVHGNLKPENLLYKTTDDDSKIMLSTFGLWKRNFLAELTLKTPCGSLIYTAPENLRQETYGKAVDVWSIGIITHTLLCGYPPFYGEDDQDLFIQIKKAEFEFASPHWDDISDAAKSFIRKLLDEDPEKRYTCRQAMEDPWICGEAAGTKNIQETVGSNIKNPIQSNVFGAASATGKMNLETSAEKL